MPVLEGSFSDKKGVVGAVYPHSLEILFRFALYMFMFQEVSTVLNFHTAF